MARNQVFNFDFNSSLLQPTTTTTPARPKLQHSIDHDQQGQLFLSLALKARYGREKERVRFGLVLKAGCSGQISILVGAFLFCCLLAPVWLGLVWLSLVWNRKLVCFHSMSQSSSFPIPQWIVSMRVDTNLTPVFHWSEFYLVWF